jgi:choline dehydrogenase-like flavoprotein
MEMVLSMQSIHLGFGQRKVCLVTLFYDILSNPVDVQIDGFLELGIPKPIEAALGKSYGAFWVPSNLNPKTIIRSYARNQYYDPVSSRANLNLIVGHRVNEVQFDSNKRAESITFVPRDNVNNTPPVTVRARQEIILCAGWLHTAQILQRSGIGPTALLTQAGIDTLVDLPGVGSNLQDHPVTGLSYNCMFLM